MPKENKPSPGRPRDSATGPALMEAARRLVIRLGYRQVSIQQIVDEAGVARQTLYRRWNSKAELVLDAFFESAGPPPVETGGPIDETLKNYLRGLFEQLTTDAPAIRSLIAAAQEDDDFLQTFKERFVRPRAQLALKLLQRARQQGQLPRHADLDMALDILHGAFWYRLLQAEPLDARFALELTDFLLRGLGSRSQRKSDSPRENGR